MEQEKINVLSFSYGRHVFDAENPESKRMQRSAASFASVHTIVFTLENDGLHELTLGPLTLHPTRSKSKWLYCFDALRIGQRILKDRIGRWVITAQDPFELGIIGLVLARWYSVPFNVQEHGDFYSRPYWRQDQIGNRVRWLLGILVLNQADTVRVVSERIARAVRARGVRSERILKLPVRTDAFDVGQKELAIETAPVYPEGSIVVLTMARLVPQKNLPLLIDAFARAVRTEPRAHLLIIGKGPLEPLLHARVHACGVADRISFVPWTNDPERYLRTADIYALSSDWEGWARVLVEAMAKGLPTVTTDVGCAGEVLKDGVHGIIVPPRDEDAFASALSRLLGDAGMRERFGEAAERDVQTVHQSPEEYAAAHARILEATYRARG